MHPDCSQSGSCNGLRKGRSLGAGTALSQTLEGQFATVKDCLPCGLLTLPASSRGQEPLTLPHTAPLQGIEVGGGEEDTNCVTMAANLPPGVALYLPQDDPQSVQVGKKP